ncbi:hypothetical protein MAR_021932 [Mya arenaria]|uniref:SAM domain-containing protein n=1 Tax=Mya arenaria TaxID=6604 RepID=A0ABY7ECX2_MYAAR|nr:hypothetical protein MAR_021932 [Mya arenaria]
MADKLSHVSSFSVKEMCEWVDSISKDLTTIFKENDIDGQGLLAVVEDDTLFKELVPKLVLRAKLKQGLFSEKRVNIWLEHLNNVAANRERGQAKAAETRSLKKKELRTETTPGGAATSTATTHRSSARSPNHSQAQSAPDNIMRMDIPDDSFEVRAEEVTDIFWATTLNL